MADTIPSVWEVINPALAIVDPWASAYRLDNS
jgi:hypothetical protein